MLINEIMPYDIVIQSCHIDQLSHMLSANEIAIAYRLITYFNYHLLVIKTEWEITRVNKC